MNLKKETNSYQCQSQEARSYVHSNSDENRTTLHFFFSKIAIGVDMLSIWTYVSSKRWRQRKKKSGSISCWCIWFHVFIINVVVTSFLLSNSQDEFIMYKHESLCPKGIQCKLTPCDPEYHTLNRLPFSVFLCFYVQVVHLVALSTGAKYVSFSLYKTEYWISMR